MNLSSSGTSRIKAALGRAICGIFLVACTLSSASGAWNAEYQFGIELEPVKNDPQFWAKTTAFLWVPPNAIKIRAVLLAPANIIERRICDDPIIREMAEKDGVAMLFFQAGWKAAVFDTPKAAQFVQTILDALATQSG